MDVEVAGDVDVRSALRAVAGITASPDGVGPDPHLAPHGPISRL